MTSVLCGVASALVWGASTLLLAAAAQGTSARRFAFWFLLSQAAVMLVPGVVAGMTTPWSLVGLGAIALAAAAEVVGMTTYRRALRCTPVGVVAPLVALEGAFAAVLAVLTGEQLSVAAGVGLALAVIGGLTVGAPKDALRMTNGGAYAVATAAMFGGALWLLAESGLDPFLALLLFNGLSATIVLGTGRPGGAEERDRAPSRRQLMLLCAGGLTSLAGQLAFVVGARAESVAVTAVLSAQFSVVAAVGGYFLFHERLRAVQLAGFATLVAGVSLVASANL